MKLTLQKSFNTTDSGYRLILKVITAEGMPSEVFVKQRFSMEPNKPDEFRAVCSWPQLSDLPVGAPDTTTSYFRSSEVEFNSTKPMTLSVIYQTILGELTQLIQEGEYSEGSSSYVTVNWSIQPRS